MAVRRSFAPVSTSPQFSPLDEGDGDQNPPIGDGGGGDGSDGSGDGEPTSPAPGDPDFVGPVPGSENGNPFPGDSTNGGKSGNSSGSGKSGGGVGDTLKKLFGSGAGDMGLGGALAALISGLLQQKRQPFTGDVAPQALAESTLGKLNDNLGFLQKQRAQGIQLPDANVAQPIALSGGVLPFTVGGFGGSLGPASIPGIGSTGQNPLALAAALQSITQNNPSVPTQAAGNLPMPPGGGGADMSKPEQPDHQSIDPLSTRRRLP